MGINGEKILVFEHELFTNCSEINETMRVKPKCAF